MNKETLHSEEGLPRAKTKKTKLKFSVIWIVPVVAALVAGYLVYQRAREFGPTITITFHDVSGVKPGQTPLQYRGAEVGQVVSVMLDKDQHNAALEVKLRRHASAVAREGSVFWIVRPQLGLGNITGLGTIITGPYIDVRPGKGKPARKFSGVENAPTTLDPQGLKVVLLAAHGGSLRPGVPIYYRGIEVGAVREARLSTNASAVEIHCVIRGGYAPLVRPESKFWNVTGMDVRVGLFKGAEVNVESLKSLIIGGIAFATPENSTSKEAKDGMVFRLYEQPEKEWLAWSPEITITPEDKDGISVSTKAEMTR